MPRDPIHHDDILTLGDAAAETGLTPRALRHRISTGELATIRHDTRLILIDRADLEPRKRLRKKP